MQHASRECVQEIDYLKLVFYQYYSFKIMTARRLRSVTKATKIGFFQPLSLVIVYAHFIFSLMMHYVTMSNETIYIRILR